MIEAVEVNRTKLLSVRMTEEEHERAEGVARRHGKSLSDLVRALLEGEAKRMRTELGQREMFDRCSRAYFRTYGADAEQPTSASEYETAPDGSTLFVLRNVRGELARYTYDAKNDRVREIKTQD